MEEVQDHAHNLGLHLAHTREDIGMDGIGNSELAKGLGLQLHELILAVVHSTRDKSILPASVIHVGEVLELGADVIMREAILGESKVSDLVLGDQLLGQLGQRLIDLLLNLASHARGS